MNRRLIVMRHAKSAWNTDAPTDHARPLNKRGRRDAPRIARRLADLDWQPTLVLSSDSQRTRETLELMNEEFGPDVEVQFTRSFYEGGVDALTQILASVPDDVPCVLALGHNPGWEAAVEWLTGERVRLTTANAALLMGSGATWRDAIRQSAAWTLHEVLRPKEL